MQISSSFTLAVHLFMCSRIWIAKFIRLCLDKRNYHNIVIPYSRNELSRTFYQKNKQQYYLLHYACCVCHLAV